MQITSPELLTQFKNLLQTELFPLLESTVGPLSKQSKLLAAVLSLARLARLVKSRRTHTGRRPANRVRLAAAFFAKAIYNLPTTRHLIQRLQTDTQMRRLCGWDTAAQVPTEATFSRAFAEFAALGLAAHVHESLVRCTQRGRVIDYIARDSTAIEARQTLPGDKDKLKRGKQVCKAAKTPRKRGAKKGPHKRAKARHRGPRLQRQQHMTLPEMIADLPQECSLGVKTSSKGRQQYWRGYKLHWDVADSGRIPISCLLTGASVHDSQAAIPLMQMSAERVRWKCDVMDSAYYAKAIREQSKKLGHETLVKPPKRRCKNQEAPTPFTDEQKQRFKKRTIVEQLNARLKDEFGGRIIYFRGAAKIMAHLMFGVVALTVDQLLRLAP
jgi:transposase